MYRIFAKFVKITIVIRSIFVKTPFPNKHLDAPNYVRDTPLFLPENHLIPPTPQTPINRYPNQPFNTLFHFLPTKTLKSLTKILPNKRILTQIQPEPFRDKTSHFLSNKRECALMIPLYPYKTHKKGSEREEKIPLTRRRFFVGSLLIRTLQAKALNLNGI